MKEIIRTSGDLRRFVGDTMMAVRNGECDTGKGQTIAALAKELTANMQVEVNVARVKMQLQKEGAGVQQISHMGKLLIGDDSVPTLDGRVSQ